MEKLKEFIKKHKRLLLIILAILLILVIIFLSLPAPKQKVAAPQTFVPGAAINQIVKTAELSPAAKAEAGISVVAKNFAEIYGSYSNQSNYANLESAMLLASVNYKNTLAGILSRYRASYRPAAEYQGVTTNVVNVLIESLDDAAGKADVLVKTQRKESAGTQANYTTKYQNIGLSIIKENGQWVVDGAEWEK